ncbi:MAG: hypothetical protein RBS19_03240 [Bacteroidales bacterium]|nr:hypothetical protein [Bacteroidales bacterium]MDY0215952.1 hypothetical protein [Bacteroidales bacterium]
MKKHTSSSKKKEVSNAEIKYAEMLYCERGMSPQAIAGEIGRNIKTIYAWRDKGMWDETKEMFDSGPIQLKKILLKEAIRITKGEVRLDEDGNEIKSIDADSLSKVMKAYDYMSTKLSPTIIRDVFVEFDNYMAGVDPKLAFDFTKYHKLFLQEKISQE